MLQLYNYYRSSASFRVRIALNLKELPYQDIPIHLTNNGGEQFSSAYQEMNPQGLVPTLKDGEKIITQSLAIIEYLEETHPTLPLLPQDAYKKSLVRAISLAIAADIHPLNNLRVLQFLTQELNVSQDNKLRWYQHWIATGLSALEKQLSTSKFTGDFCFGNLPTMADVCLVPQIYNARRYECDLSGYPLLTRIDSHCQKLPAFIKAWPNET